MQMKTRNMSGEWNVEWNIMRNVTKINANHKQLGVKRTENKQERN